MEEMQSETRNEEVVAYNNISAKKTRLQSMLSALLDDPVLSDVPKKPTLADVDILINLELGSAMKVSVVKMDQNSFDVDILINLELGSAMKVSVVKMDQNSFDVAVLNSATVKGLKMAIRRKINEMEQAKMGHRHISWRHVWGNFCLSHQGEKLIDEKSLLSDFGVRNNSKVHFVPYVASRETRKHSRRRKHRFFHGLSK